MSVEQEARSRAAQVYAELLARAPENKMQPRLGPVRLLCEILGDPQKAYPVILVTGTNGKTSVVRMIERILREHNLRTGRYTSPHLHVVNERIAIDGVPVSDQVFADTWEEIANLVAMVDGRLATEGEPPLTYFELLTVMAYAIFADAPVDVAVVEVGLGGTWDATNVADPAVSVVTPISLDHTAWLGNTVAQIAAEKAGIFRHNGFAVIGTQSREAMVELGAAAATVGLKVARQGVDFGVLERRAAVGGQDIAIKGLAATYQGLFVPLLGEYQAQNAAIAVAALEAFLGDGERPLTPDVLRIGLAESTSPGRLELLRTSPAIVVDAAHNPGGVAALAEAVKDSFAFEHLVGVVGILGDKDADGILELLEPHLQQIVLTRSSSPRALPPAELAELALDLFDDERVHVVERLDDAIATAVDLAEARDDVSSGVLVTGSVTIAAEARLLLGAAAVDSEAEEDRIVQEDVPLEDPDEADPYDSDRP